MNNYAVNQIREKLKGRTIHVIPYCHADYAWTHYRQWHIERYILIINEVLDIMKKYPDFTWMLDNKHHILEPFIKYCPDKVNELKERLAEGRLEITNAIISLVRPTQVGEETFIRNIVLGRKFFKNLFPQLDVSVYHSVDVSIGHHQLPQLLKLGGYDYYRGWRPQGAMDYMGIPRQFIWKGLDGTTIVCARGFYGGVCRTDYMDTGLEKNWDDVVCKFYVSEVKDIVEHSQVPDLWISYGMDDSRPLSDISDKPSRFIEFIKEWKAKENSNITFSSARKYFENIARHELPLIEGTLDSCDVGYNTPTKGENGLWRKRQLLDRLLVKAETLCSFASLCGDRYPEEEFDSFWTMLLGISGHAQEFALDKDFNELYSSALAAEYHIKELIKQTKTNLSAKITRRFNKQHAVFNTLNWEREEIIPLHIAFPEGGKSFELIDAYGDKLEYQICHVFKGDIDYLGAQYDEMDVLAKVKVPSLGYTSIGIVEKNDCSNGTENFGIELENIDFKINGGNVQTVDTGELKVEFSCGRIIKILDKNDSVIFSENSEISKINCLKFTRVKQHTKNSWLFFSHHQGEETMKINSWAWEEYGPLRWKYTVRGDIGINVVKQEIILYKGRKEIDFAVEIMCNESSTGFFSAGFPMQPGSKIVGDIPFGMEKRNIKEEAYGKLSDNFIDNIERNWAGLFYSKSWVNYELFGRNASIISFDCGPYFMADEYNGCLSIILTRVIDVENQEDWMKFSHPSMNCKGRHYFNYSLYFIDSEEDLLSLVKLSREKTCSLETEVKLQSSKHELFAEEQSFVDNRSDSAIISAFYKVEDKYILRLYEAKGESSSLKIKTCKKLNCVTAVDFLGRYIERNEIIIGEDKYTFETLLKSWEVINLVLEFQF